MGHGIGDTSAMITTTVQAINSDDTKYTINSKLNTIGGEFDSLHETFAGVECNQLGITPSQQRLAEITEMIHTASLLHDDVIDLATTRRYL